MIGVGYRASLKGNTLVILAGYSHPVNMEIPEGLTVEVPKNTQIFISGIDKQLVGYKRYSDSSLMVKQKCHY